MKENEKKVLLLEVRKTGRLSNGGLSELYWLGLREQKLVLSQLDLRQVERLAVSKCKQLHPER